MKDITLGIVAHVDAGKTTLSEALLYQAGTLRTMGRVDTGDAFLDPDALEKQRGITIKAHQASLQTDALNLTLLDTPGHADFASQTEQVLSVLDYAILVVTATEGVRGYTRTLWNLLTRYAVPTFIFISKTDAVGAAPASVLAQLQAELAPGCVNFEELGAATMEEIALLDETALDEFMATETLTDATIQELVRARKLVPCYTGAALKMDGVSALLAGLERWTVPMAPEPTLAARVFKISRDDKGERLTWLRVLGGTLHAKDVLVDAQKVNQLRMYNGAKFTAVPEVAAGGVCAIPGLVNTTPGQGLGVAADGLAAVVQPVLTYVVQYAAADQSRCLSALRELADEDPQLHVSWSTEVQKLRVQIMGAVQLEVLTQTLLERYKLTVTFDAGSILYRETVTAPVEGVGHFEPLRHYAEAHLLLEPTPRGSGLTFASDCSLEMLTRNWQHQVLTNLGAKQHRGVLMGAPVTDMRITLVSGRAHIKHTEGGDFREATWRAVRQGLMMARAAGTTQLLEPWYRFRLDVPTAQVGRAMTDVQRMAGTAELVGARGGATATLTGVAPVATMQNYAQEVRSYTHGQGELECVVDGYRVCHNAAVVIADRAYVPTADLENTPDSVFCAHGAGYPVAWAAVPGLAHVAYQPSRP